MQKLVQGIHKFQRAVFSARVEEFERLVGGQHPAVLFITCSDSRLDPNLFTQTDPGDLFVLRNAGNFVPAWPQTGGEAATIEYALSVLGIKDIVVCGHTRCGAVTALFGDSQKLAPSIAQWLTHAEGTKRIIEGNYQHLSGEAKITAAVEENVLVQLENLKTHPAVLAGVSKKDLRLHGWVYKLETGKVFAYDSAAGQFLEVAEDKGKAASVSRVA